VIKVEDLGLTQEEINEINKGIPFVDAKLYWKEGYGWTSQYWEKLYKLGWRMVESEKEPGVFLAVDEKGATVLSADSKLSLFKLLVNFMVGGG
jgi:hypothetical protein